MASKSEYPYLDLRALTKLTKLRLKPLINNFSCPPQLLDLDAEWISDESWADLSYCHALQNVRTIQYSDPEAIVHFPHLQQLSLELCDGDAVTWAARLARSCTARAQFQLSRNVCPKALGRAEFQGLRLQTLSISESCAAWALQKLNVEHLQLRHFEGDSLTQLPESLITCNIRAPGARAITAAFSQFPNLQFCRLEVQQDCRVSCSPPAVKHSMHGWACYEWHSSSKRTRR